MLESIVKNPVLLLVCRLVVGYIFVSYGFEKILAPKDFAHSIMNYEMMPHAWVNMAALVMPWVEVFAGAMLIFGIRVRAAALIASAMLVMFIMAIGSAMTRGLEINCGCSAHAEPVGFPKIFEDLGFLVLSLLLVLFPSQRWTLDAYVQAQAVLRAPFTEQNQTPPTAEQQELAA